MIFGWVTFAAVGGGVFAFSYFILLFYGDPGQARYSSSLVGSITLSLAILCLLLIPLDIYNVSSSEINSVEGEAAVIRTLYYAFFCGPADRHGRVHPLRVVLPRGWCGGRQHDDGGPLEQEL